MVIGGAKKFVNKRRDEGRSMLARSREWDVEEKSEFLGLWECLHDWGGKRIEQSVRCAIHWVSQCNCLSCGDFQHGTTEICARIEGK